MHSNLQKFLFLGIVMAVVLISGATHPSLFISQDAAPGGRTRARPNGDPPLLVLPSLTADIGGGVSTLPSNTASTRPPAPISVKAAAALAADLTSGKVLFRKNADERWPLASVSKLMTAAVASDLMAHDQRVTITEPMMAVDPAERVLQTGDTYTVADLLRVMLLPSNNVAAEALAEFSGRARFIAAMGAKARAWGMVNTYYDDPSGLSAANQSTANDLLTLARHIYAEYPQIFAITRMPQAAVNNISTAKVITIKNRNDFAGEPDFLGGKTGYTDEANGNLLSLFSYRGRIVFIVVLGTSSGNRFEDTRKLFGWFKAP